MINFAVEYTKITTKIAKFVCSYGVLFRAVGIKDLCADRFGR